jgi:anti-anti-sigma factor
MDIEQSAQDGCVVLTLIGNLDVAAAPQVQRVLLRCLAEQPDSVICDLSKLAALDPVCATVFAAVARRPASRWPESSILLCCAQPAVADVLTRVPSPYLLPVFRTLDQAVAHARSRPPFLRERLRVVPTIEAIETARWFVAVVCRRWQLDGSTETAQLLAAELVTDAVLHERATHKPIELRMELRATGLLIAVRSGESPLALSEVDHDSDPRSGLDVVRRVAHSWGTLPLADGSRVVWCTIQPATDLDASAAGLPNRPTDA